MIKFSLALIARSFLVLILVSAQFVSAEHQIEKLDDHEHHHVDCQICLSQSTFAAFAHVTLVAVAIVQTSKYPLRIDDLFAFQRPMAFSIRAPPPNPLL